MRNLYYQRSQVSPNGITPDRMRALMFFLWGSRKPLNAAEKEAYDMDERALQDMVWTPVDVTLTLQEVDNL